MFLPLYVPLVVARARPILSLAEPRARLWPLIWVIMASVAGLGWVISMSRGAWLGLLGASALWALWRGTGWGIRRTQGHPQHAWPLRLGLMAGFLVAGMLIAWVLAVLTLAGRLPGGGALANRLNLYRDALLLARDYRLIGAGLGMFQIQFSIYTLLIHVGYIIYSHNMLLSILIAQGLLGLLPFLGLLGATLSLGLSHMRRVEQRAGGSCRNEGAQVKSLPDAGEGEQSGGLSYIICEAALASLAVVLIHGLVDDVLYGSRGALLLFLPCALVAAAAARPSEPSATRRRTLRMRRQKARMAYVVVSALVLGLALIVGGRTIKGAWYANLGALEQARAELSVYDPIHFDKITMDQARQQVNLDQARRLLTRAKEVDPANPTARQRLASIDLSLGRYPEALAELQAAWDAGHRDSVTRMLYGDALVAAGQPERAAEVIRGLTWAEARLLGQAWSRYWVSKDYRRAADAWTAVLLLNPGNNTAAQSRAEAEKRSGESQ
jgi:hypothetical protein